MAETQYEFERFSNREGFNRSLSHFQSVSSLLEDFEDEFNLADILNSLIGEKELEQDQIHPILSAILIDKYAYRSSTHNLQSTIEDFDHVKTECPTWNGVDIVVAYQHPDLGVTLINPKNPDHWDIVQSIRKNELITIYAGGFSDSVSESVATKAIDTIILFLEGKKIKTPAAITNGEFEYEPYDEIEEEEESDDSGSLDRDRPKRRREPIRASASSSDKGDEGDDEEYEEEDEEDEESSTSPAAQPSGKPQEPAATGNRRMTPMYSVPVTNELFHNGNVEAWKKIIQSYQLKYPGTDVLVFYEGERIHDINTLFKWGKVKHGSTILFAIVGEEIKDAAKLQRYFRQGASSQFEAFLQVPVNTVLKLL